MDVLATAAHELRTPVTAIAGFAGTLREHRHRMTQADIDDALSTLERQAHRLARTVDDLLDIGRLSQDTPPRTGPVDLAEVVADALRTAPPPDDMPVTLQHPRSGRSRTVTADGATLSRLVVNLLTNAYRSGGSRVTVSITAEPGGDDVLLGVEDDGAGVPSVIESTMFEPFVTHGRPGQSVPGTGLGLAIARRAAESFGGRLEHEHAHPHGAGFVLTLPRGSGG